MRVLMLLGKSTGGIGTHVVGLTRGLRAGGVEVQVVTDPLTAERFGLTDAELLWPDRAAGVLLNLRKLARLRRLAQHTDVVHAHGHQAGLVAALATGGLSVPVIVSQHNAVLGTGAKRWVLDLAQRIVSRRAEVVTGASSDLVEEAERLGARHTWLAEVPSPRVPGLLDAAPPAEVERRAAARELLRANGIDVPPNTPMVLTVARIAPQKDLDTFVDLMAVLEVPAVGVVIGGGDESLRAELARRISSDRLPVHLVGPQADPERWLRAADVFVLTSTWEARALVVQEAMAAGVPVVATATGGLPDLVEGVGSLVPVGHAALAADAVATYLQDEAARHTASVKGRERAATWADDAATARRWQQWYDHHRR